MILADFISLFFPKVCDACAQPLIRGEEVICTQCLLELPRTDSHILSNKPLEAKFYGKININKAYSFLYFRKDGNVQNLLHNLKYKGKPYIGEFVGKLFARELKDLDHIRCIDLIIPVPLHQSKLRRRGYNQSEHFALGLSSGLELPMDTEALKRIIKNTTQTKKSRLERWQNVENVFHVQKPEMVAGKHVLLADDVVTTGATLEACAIQLFSAGAKEVTVATIAMAV